MCDVCSFLGSYILHTDIMCWKHFDTQINVLTNEVWICEWMDVTQISHLLINLCVNFVFNAQYKCMKHMNYEWMNFALVPLLSCRNPSLGFMTKVRGCKVAGQEKDLGVISHAPESAKSVREWTLTLTSELPCWELESQMEFQIFRTQLQGSKLIGWKKSLYYWKAIETWMSKMGLHRPFGHLKHKLWPKKRPGVKLAIWLPTTKSLELTQFPCL